MKAFAIKIVFMATAFLPLLNKWLMAAMRIAIKQLPYEVQFKCIDN